MAQGKCYECGDSIEVAMYDVPALSGAAVLVCHSCQDTVPEACLWDVSEIEAAHEQWENGDSNIISEHPLEDGDSWAVQDRNSSFEVYAHHFEASWDGVMPDGALEDLEERINLEEREARWDIFVHTADDREAVESARAFLREQKL